MPTAAAGVGLTAFSASLLGLYARTPGMTKQDGIRPSQQGTALAKDVWMLGIGLGLTLDALTDRSRPGTPAVAAPAGRRGRLSARAAARRPASARAGIPRPGQAALLTASRTSTTNTSVSVPLMPADDCPADP